ncbi:Serine protease [Austwickia sp. TVS 96-490-7B]|uniref:MarP family serine protease n=1 Tax=Austwickia sp. TVS 96-490-7B TaxID=2830843 RepID=UPI001C5A3F24|nr:MarP family serine protease [Austwickia sp. TVS 96-490-7B]MBW3084922.1 Serine protease [Austwickia sp. TVS 96-490-7B]
MSQETVIDIVLVAFILFSGFSGYRRGLVSTLFAAAGFLIGSGLALWLLPEYIADLPLHGNPLLRPLLLVASVLACAGAMQGLLVRATFRLTDSIDRSPLGKIDALLGSVLTVTVTAATVWFTAGVMRVVIPGDLSRSIGGSHVVSAIGEVMPTTSDQVLGGVKATLDDYGFPRVFSAINTEPIRPVMPVDPAVAQTPQIRRASASVLRIDADATQCQRMQEGSGWVFARQLVVTNAHVVAGSRKVTVRHLSSRLPAKVVAFDAARDLAVLAVPGLTAAPLALGEDLAHSDSAVVAGYPRGGPLRVEAARVREVLDAKGDDIYGQAQVQRKVYSLLATVQPGNSGGPLLSPDGKVSAVVFARSQDDPLTGYALTLDEVREVTAGVTTSSAVTETGTCTSGN